MKFLKIQECMHCAQFGKTRNSLTKKIFRQINSLLTSFLISQLLSRNFCKRCVRENSRNFYTVEFTLAGEISRQNNYLVIKHEYLRSRAYINMFVTFITIFSFSDQQSNLTNIEIFVLLSWIPASKEFFYQQICMLLSRKFLPK